MSETALYRKYRPGSFSEVSDQDHVIEVLLGALKQGKPSHAYLFAGPRGTGKTSVARILAKELGCQPNDLYEIDAASNRGVDEIRELREGVRSLPFESPVKVYIIDEVHMLTREAFNALLKTLEEPPRHVVFILATTELHKLPETIISRCQTFTFRRPSINTLQSLAKNIAKKEGYNITPEAASLIAFLGDGSFRDTLGILQKVLATAEKEVTGDAVQKVAGIPQLTLIHDFLLALLNKDTASGLAVIHRAVADNRDMKIFLRLILRELRQAMLYKFSPAIKKELTAELGEAISPIAKLAGHENGSQMPVYLKELLASHELISTFTLPQLALELAVIKLTQLK